MVALFVYDTSLNSFTRNVTGAPDAFCIGMSIHSQSYCGIAVAQSLRYANYISTICNCYACACYDKHSAYRTSDIGKLKGFAAAEPVGLPRRP